MDHDDKTMLALAALTYRGFAMHSEAAIDQVLRSWLPKLQAEQLGNWDVVWGPATFRTTTSLFDDVMMYVARQLDLPAGDRPRYAVAIRGTNPISVLDWVLGDFWVHLQVDSLSASTSLGLAVIQHLAAERPPSPAVRLAGFANDVADAMQDFAAMLPELHPGQVLKLPASFSDADLITRVKSIIDARAETPRPTFFFRLLERFGDPIERRAYDLLIRRIATTQDPGKKLIDFLNEAVEPNARVAVTGHSKGGALAAATALWLSETWQPARTTAELSCFSFAGPTPGNGKFAQRYDASLAARTRRIINTRDVVPHAWVPDELRGMQKFYPQLGFALTGVASSVAKLGYSHVGGQLIQFTPPAGGAPTLFEEIIHQHLDAYLKEAGFQGPDWKATSIFLE
jgi:hypothetical protein